MKQRIRRSLAALELGPEATFAEVVSSYRELERVWHPDRFPGDPGLQARGARKLEKLRKALEHLEANRSALHGGSSSSRRPKAERAQA